MTTLFVIGLVAFVVAMQFALCRGPVAWIPWLTMGLLVPALVPAWALAPTAVEITPAGLEIQRRGWRPFRVARTDIESAAPAPAVSRITTIRIFGAGGFFGTYGLLWVRGLGRVRAYVTRQTPGAVIHRCGALPIVFTPDDPAAVLGALYAHGIPPTPPPA